MSLRTRGGGIAAAVAGSVLVLAAPAGAAHHLLKISEVYPGSTTHGPGAEFVELQLPSAGENQVGGGTAQVDIYNALGTVSGGTPFLTDAPNGEAQRTILVATGAAQAAFGVAPDQLLPDGDAIGAAGTACLNSTLFATSVDCVSWGVGVTPPVDSSPAGTATAAIGDGMSITRDISRGCATRLDGPDDTNNSAADFVQRPPTPRSNGTAPTEVPCTGGGGDTDPPDTEITKAPRKKSAKKRIAVEFRSTEDGSTFECRLDKGEFARCSSPFRKKVKVGKHTFAVRASDAAGNTDGSPASIKFRRTAK